MVNYDNAKDLLTWEFDFALSTYYEIETEAIEHLLPKQLNPIEVAPGIALMSLTALNFPPGALGHLPEFQELIFGLIVTPDLSRGVPKFAMYIVSLSSTNREHLEHCVQHYRLPVHGQFTGVSLQHDPHVVEYEDADGPILSMRNIHPNPAYGEGERYFQAFVMDNDRLYVADVVMKGSLFEHQQTGDAGKLWPHPFYNGVDVEAAEPVAFMQMLNEPGTMGKQLYPRPEKFR
ncbi:MAG: hypothetical protein JSW54_05550 [Fidelibacterota bacterium]|nr:MAG: hypothetical protein JSW54_05550 [Candidatus Neomarinimicrobiota bacterium]